MITEKEIVKMLRAVVNEAASMRQWAVDHNVSVAYVSDVLKGHRKPRKKILDALGYERVVTVVIKKKNDN